MQFALNKSRLTVPNHHHLHVSESPSVIFMCLNMSSCIVSLWSFAWFGFMYLSLPGFSPYIPFKESSLSHYIELEKVNKIFWGEKPITKEILRPSLLVLREKGRERLCSADLDNRFCIWDLLIVPLFSQTCIINHKLKNSWRAVILLHLFCLGCCHRTSP